MFSDPSVSRGVYQFHAHSAHNTALITRTAGARTEQQMVVASRIDAANLEI